ncbi:hypothetical protein, partial [Streptomyces tendae]
MAAEPVVRTAVTDDWQVSILGPAGNPVGGGVIVPPRYVLTCAHVVTSAMGGRLEDDPHATVTVTLSSGLKLTGSPGGGHRYTGGSHHEDVSVLTLHGDLGRRRRGPARSSRAWPPRGSASCGRRAASGWPG